MNSKEFLTAKLKELSSIFEDIKIRYEYRKSTCSHIIEIIPLAVFRNNEDYMSAEANLEDEFEHLFPQEDIVFISEGSLTEIKDPDLILGYNSIVFDNIFFDTDLIVNGFSEEVNVAGCENYALAA
jgi:hypothetical protein